MFSLFFDEDRLHAAVIAGARARGLDCLTVGEAHRYGLADLEQLEYAAAVGRVMFTSNARDFAVLHRDYLSSGREHSGIVVLTDQLMPVGVQIQALTNLTRHCSHDDMRNQLRFLANYV